MGYISQETLKKLLGNVSDANVGTEVLAAADLFCNGTIDSKFGGPLPPGSAPYNSAVGIAYLLGKVFAQYGNETEAVRSLDFDIAMKLLDGLYNSLAASGELNNILVVDKATTDDIDDRGVTSPLNPDGITIIGASKGNIIAGRKNALNVFTEIP